ncbi:MAG TPA: hypothetical protein VKV30_04095, partial [Candidatus Angelobacter sp.]|nr:hypothetical protein [Candidatus Angelobacter sp.]
ERRRSLWVNARGKNLSGFGAKRHPHWLKQGEAGLRAEPKDAGAHGVNARAKYLSGFGAERHPHWLKQGEAGLRAEPKDAGACGSMPEGKT